MNDSRHARPWNGRDAGGKLYAVKDGESWKQNRWILLAVVVSVCGVLVLIAYGVARMWPEIREGVGTGTVASILGVLLAGGVALYQALDLGISLRRQTSSLRNISNDLSLNLRQLSVDEGLEEIEERLTGGEVQELIWVSGMSAVPGFWLKPQILASFERAITTGPALGGRTRKEILGPDKETLDNHIERVVDGMLAENLRPTEAIETWRRKLLVHDGFENGDDSASRNWSEFTGKEDAKERLTEVINSEYRKCIGYLEDRECIVKECVSKRSVNFVLLRLRSRTELGGYFELILFGDEDFGYNQPLDGASIEGLLPEVLLEDPVVYSSRHPFLGRTIWDHIESLRMGSP